MKKLFFSLAAVVALFATSCVSEVAPNVQMGGEECNVTFSLKTTNPVSRAETIGKGLLATDLTYAVYDANWKHLLTKTATLSGSPLQTTVTVSLVKGMTYNFVFWAQSPNATCYTLDLDTDGVMPNLKVDYSALNANDETLDAFFGKLTNYVVGSKIDEVVFLKRPFAQVNFGTDDAEAAALVGYSLENATSKFTTRAYNTLYLNDGAVEGEQDVTFTYDVLPGATNVDDQTLKTTNGDYRWVAMNYLLWPATETPLSTCAMTISANGHEVMVEYPNAPACRNWRTNLVGSLFTKTGDITVIIAPEFNTEEYNKEVVDYKEVAPGVLYDEANATYMLTEKSGLDWFRDEVNAGNTFESKVVTLTNDIDAGIEYDANGERISFATIGTCSKTVKNPFKGTFDGAGHTIKNIYQNGWDFGYEMYKWGSLGLFGKLEDATVKNVTLEGFELRVEKGNCGGIAGNAAGDCTFENITVKNSILCSFENGVAGILGWPEAGNYLFKNIVIESDVNIASFWGAHGSSLGGVLAEAYTDGTYHFEDIVVNCRLDAYNDVVSNYQWYAYRICGMLVGNVETTKEMDGRVVPDPAGCNITCNNVVVNYGDWMNYHYCESPAYGTPSYADEGEWKFHRVEPGYSYDGVDLNNCNHGENETHNEYIPFDQIFGGGPNGYGDSPVYGLKSYDGVTVNYPASYTPAN